MDEVRDGLFDPVAKETRNAVGERFERWRRVRFQAFLRNSWLQIVV